MAWWNPFSSADNSKPVRINTDSIAEKKEKLGQYKLDSSIMTQADEQKKQEAFAKSPTGAAVIATVQDAKKDWARVKETFKEEGLEPAIFDTVATTGNIGKNVLRGIKAHGDRAVEYTKTNIAAIDKTIGADGLGKVISGTAGLVTETVGFAGSIFSTESESTTKAVKYVAAEGSSVLDGLGTIAGKGWLWGEDKKEVKATEKTTETKVTQKANQPQKENNANGTDKKIKNENVEDEIAKLLYENIDSMSGNHLPENTGKDVKTIFTEQKTSLDDEKYPEMHAIMRKQPLKTNKKGTTQQTKKSSKTNKKKTPRKIQKAKTQNKDKTKLNITPERAAQVFENVLALQKGEPVPYPKAWEAEEQSFSPDKLQYQNKVIVPADLKDLLDEVDLPPISASQNSNSFVNPENSNKATEHSPSHFMPKCKLSLMARVDLKNLPNSEAGIKTNETPAVNSENQTNKTNSTIQKEEAPVLSKEEKEEQVESLDEILKKNVDENLPIRSQQDCLEELLDIPGNKKVSDKYKEYLNLCLWFIFK